MLEIIGLVVALIVLVFTYYKGRRMVKSESIMVVWLVI